MGKILEVFAIEWELLAVNIFNFTVLLLALTYLLYKPVIKLLDERREKIEKGLKDAQKAHERLNEIENEKKEILSEAQKQAQETLEKAKSVAKSERDALLQEAQTKSVTMIELAKRQANEAKEEVMREAKEEIAKEATLIAEKILKAQN